MEAGPWGDTTVAFNPVNSAVNRGNGKSILELMVTEDSSLKCAVCKNFISGNTVCLIEHHGGDDEKSQHVRCILKRPPYKQSGPCPATWLCTKEQVGSLDHIKGFGTALSQPQRDEVVAAFQAAWHKAKFDKSTATCFRCHEVGHFAGECPQKFRGAGPPAPARASQPTPLPEAPPKKKAKRSTVYEDDPDYGS
jgi:hypothetical protein